jgi:hypothetical protein
MELGENVQVDHMTVTKNVGVERSNRTFREEFYIERTSTSMEYINHVLEAQDLSQDT